MVHGSLHSQYTTASLQLGKGKPRVESQFPTDNMPVTCSSRPISTVGTSGDGILFCFGRLLSRIRGLSVIQSRYDYRQQQPFPPENPSGSWQHSESLQTELAVNGGWMLLLQGPACPAELPCSVAESRICLPESTIWPGLGLLRPACSESGSQSSRVIQHRNTKQLHRCCGQWSMACGPTAGKAALVPSDTCPTGIEGHAKAKN